MRGAVAAVWCVVASAGAASAQTAPAAALEGEDALIARVNGDEIYRSDMVLLYEKLPEEYRQIPIEILYPQLVDRLVDRKLLAQAGRRSGLTDDPVVRRRAAFAEDTILQETYLFRHIEETVTEEQLRAAYEEMKAETEEKEQVRARHILLDSEAEAEAAIGALKAGNDFAELAKEKSTGPSAEQGGDLGYFERDEVVEDFGDAAFALRPGEVTPNPVRTQFGWHVIKVEDRRTAPAPTFEESRDKLVAAAAPKIAETEVSRLREMAEIVTFGLDGAEMPRTSSGDPASE